MFHNIKRFAVFAGLAVMCFIISRDWGGCCRAGLGLIIARDWWGLRPSEDVFHHIQRFAGFAGPAGIYFIIFRDSWALQGKRECV